MPWVESPKAGGMHFLRGSRGHKKDRKAITLLTFFSFKMIMTIWSNLCMRLQGLTGLVNLGDTKQWYYGKQGLDSQIFILAQTSTCWYIRDYLSSHMFALCIYCICSLSSKLRSLRIPLSKACAIFDWILDSFSDLSPKIWSFGSRISAGPHEIPVLQRLGQEQEEAGNVRWVTARGLGWLRGRVWLTAFFLDGRKQLYSWLPTVSRHLLLALLEIRC